MGFRQAVNCTYWTYLPVLVPRCLLLRYDCALCELLRFLCGDLALKQQAIKTISPTVQQTLSLPDHLSYPTMSPTITNRSRSTSPLHHRLRKYKRTSSPEYHLRQQQHQHQQEEPRRNQLRRSSLPNDIRYTEPSPLLNAEWDFDFFNRKNVRNLDCSMSLPASPMKDRSLPTHLHSSRRSSTSSDSNTLINLDELKTLTLCLWTNNFAGTVDPRFHSEYFHSSKTLPLQQLFEDAEKLA